MWYHFLIINSSSKSYYLWPIQWCNLKFQSIIPYYKGISLNFKVMYLRVSTLQTVVCGVYGVSIFSYARLTSSGAIKSSNYECVNFREGTCNSYIFQCWYRRYHIDIDITIWGFEYRHAMCGCRWRLDMIVSSCRWRLDIVMILLRYRRYRFISALQRLTQVHYIYDINKMAA